MSGECDRCGDHCLDCSCDLRESIEVAWPRVQVDQTPPASFQAMLRVMEKFRRFFELKMKYFDCKKNIQESMMSQHITATDSIYMHMLNRIADLGRAQERLKTILDDEIFNNLSKHNAYWESEHEKEDEKLYDIRCKLSCLLDNLWDLFAILRKEEG